MRVVLDTNVVSVSYTHLDVYKRQVCLLLAGALAWRARGQAAGSGQPSLRSGGIVPWFILWFIAASLLRTLGYVPAAMLAGLHLAASMAMVLALAAIGLSANLQHCLLYTSRCV